MDNKFLFETKPDGTEIWWHTDGVFITIQHTVPVEKILADNKAAEAEFTKNAKHGNLIKHAELPAQMYFDLLEKGVIEDRDRLKRFLNDADNKYLRTNNMRL